MHERGKEVVTVKNTPEIGIIHIVVMIKSQRGQKHQVCRLHTEQMQAYVSAFKG